VLGSLPPGRLKSGDFSYEASPHALTEWSAKRLLPDDIAILEAKLVFGRESLLRGEEFEVEEVRADVEEAGGDFMETSCICPCDGLPVGKSSSFLACLW